ncbi:NAD(P)H dehydrogenase [Sphingobium lactosutens]|uniref:NAD(P)H:quinone oxidoreductase n=1 Tax=Sphingobium lactosutens TaxID=522773 RepID=UPI0015B9A679|nr:NAD(P)H:quinone oxidoreductase [Sphingobium lactosutens]NWK98599.1 NAD(P)H dehydrogenase [Sphingobium lactosutens]
MPKILIVFHSRDGMTEALSRAVAEGAAAAGGEVRIRRAREMVTPDVMAMVPGWADNATRMNALYPAPVADDAHWADAILFGTPSRFGLVCAEVKAYLDSLGALWARGQLVNKVGSAFASSGSTHGGNEVTSLTLFVPMAHFGMVIVPPGFADPAMFQAGTPYGASAVSHNRPGALPSDAECAAARFQGRHVTAITAALKGAGLHPME